MKYILLPLMVVLMAGLVSGAFIWDCVRLDRQYAADIAAVDGDMLKHEDRLIKAVQGIPQLPDDVHVAIKSYHAAQGREDRHEAYDTLRATTERSLSTVLDPTDPLARRVMDDVNGAINRRTVAERPYLETLGNYEAWQKTFRGRVAGTFAGTAQP